MYIADEEDDEEMEDDEADQKVACLFLSFF